VKLFPGTGSIVINGLSALDYLKRETLVMIIEQPLDVIEARGTYDIVAKAKGGGLTGQAGAVRLGIARSLQRVNTGNHRPLRQAGLLTRDPRKVERKKTRAARSTQKIPVFQALDQSILSGYHMYPDCFTGANETTLNC
jgi:small subunit ribosomal protein S9